jgi:multiple sugar transport system substrate-binding protein
MMSDTARRDSGPKNRRLLGFRRRDVVMLVLGVSLALIAIGLHPVLFGNGRLEPGELVIYSGRDESPGGQRQRLVDEWNSTHPDNQARIKELSPNAVQQHADMVADAQGPREADIYNLDVTWVPEFAAAHYVRPLDGVRTDGFIDKPLATCRYQGRLWALPFNTDAALLYYRTDRVTDLPDRLPPDGGRPGSAPYAVQLVDEGLTVNALEAIWSAGGDIRGGTDQPGVDSSETQRGLRDMAANARALAVTLKQPVSDLLGRFDENAATMAFADGKVTMMRNWPVAYAKLKDHDTGEQQPGVDVSRNFEVTTLPSPSVLGGQDLAVSSATRKPRAAQALVEFLTSEHSERELFERGGLAATRESVYGDEAVVEARPYARTLLRAIHGARPRPTTPYYNLLSTELQAIVRATLTDPQGREPADARRRIDDALRGRRGP